MKLIRWQVFLGTALVALSASIYIIQVSEFKRPADSAFYFFQDLAFLPLEVLLVTLILSRILHLREKRDRLRKMNMVIGAFFNEAGSGLIERCAGFIQNFIEAGKPLRVQAAWTPKKFMKASAQFKQRKDILDSRRGDLAEMKRFLAQKREFLLRLLENPNLLEHDTFTDLLLAVFHLADELEHRTDLTKLPESDLDHLSGDMNRVFTFLVTEWLAYLRYLKSDYPYLFSLAVRTNPFDPDASAVVT
jgi:hypothetical protein